MRKLWLLLIAGALAVPCAIAAPPEPVVEDVRRIWDAAPHNAFTDLVRWNDQWYCTFREGDGHVGGNGKTRVIVSADGEAWTSAALMAEEGIDLRDPKLSITPDNRLMAVMGGSLYVDNDLKGMQPRVSFSADGTTWTAPQPIMEDGHWLWRVTWHEGTAYGISYGREDSGERWGATLVKSTDGLDWTTVSDMDSDPYCNEGTLRFAEDGTCHAILRRDGGDNQGWLGQAVPPYTDWKWTPSGHQLGGPEFIMTPHGWWAGSRAYTGGATTVVARMTADTYAPVLTLPSGGDTSYPGMVWHDGRIWMSYYSSHEDKSAIYLARIAFSPEATGAPSE
jgi:hypothetical protein